MARWSLTTTSRSFVTFVVISLLLVSIGCHRSSSSGSGGGVGTNISGNLSLPGSPFTPGATPGNPTATAVISNATIEAIDADGNVVATATTGASGNFTLKVPDGSYKIGVRNGTTPYFTPLTQSVIVQNGTVQGLVSNDLGDASLPANILKFESPPPVGQDISGDIFINGSVPTETVTLEFVDASTGTVRFTTTASTVDGSFAVAGALPAGTFIVRVAADSVPAGSAVPTPQTISVSASGLLVDGTATNNLDYDVPSATETVGLVSTTSGFAPLASLAPEGDLQPAFVPEVPLVVESGAEVIVSEMGFGEVARFPIDVDGAFTLDLRDGSYILEFSGLGDGVVAPTPMRITVQGGQIFTDGSDTPLDPSVDSLASTAHDVSATLTGSVTFEGNPIGTRVFALHPTTGGVLAEADTDEDGAYSLPLADGSYDIWVDENSLPPGIVPPSRVRIAVEAAADPSAPFKEESGTADDGIVDFVLETADITLTGIVTDNSANPLKDVQVLATKGDDTVARAVTDSTGNYTLSLPVGTVDIGLVSATIPPGVLLPEDVRIEVASDGVITGANGAITILHFVLEQRSTPNVQGTVAFDFDGDGLTDVDDTDGIAEFVGCRVLIYDINEEFILADTPSSASTGRYSFILADGSYVIGVDPETCPPGSAPPPRKRITVSATGVTTESDPVQEALKIIDFNLVRRASTLTGLVSLDSRGASVGLQLVDTATGALVTLVSSEPLTGEYRMPLFPGAYELRIDPATLPSGTAIPNAEQLSVDADGTILSTGGAITSLNITLTRNVATLTGLVTVLRDSDVLPVEVNIEVRDPQSLAVLETTRTDPATGGYTLRLLEGSKQIAIQPDSLPPGVLPVPPASVSVDGTTITVDGTVAATLDFALADVRQSGVDISGALFDVTTFQPIEGELRLFDPTSGSATENFILSIPTDLFGAFSFRAVDGTYELAVFPDSIPTTALPPASVIFAVQGTDVVESNTTLVGGFGTNTTDDGIINLAISDGATSGITVTGTVTDGGVPAAAIAGVQVFVRNSSTGDIVAEQLVDPVSGQYTFRLPLGGYVIEIDPGSLPFTFLLPPAQSVLATNNSGIQVSTNNGAVVLPNGTGDYEFDFVPVSASQSLVGTVLDAASAGVRVFVNVKDSLTDEFISGRWSDDFDGSFQFLLAPGSYVVSIDSPSVPFGMVGPPAVAVTVTSADILEQSGAEDDGVLDLQLVDASRVISGSVLREDDSSAIACYVMIQNALSGEFVAGSPTAATDGSYDAVVPPGVYNVFVDQPSLPPGFTPPPPLTIDANDGDVTVDFSVQVASLCITGTVLSATAEIPLPAFVAVINASTEQPISGAPTEPDGSYSICVAPGSYLLKIEPDSLPSGTIVPAPVTVQVTVGLVVEEDETGTGNAIDDGVVNFRVSEDVPDAELSGSVTLVTPGGSEPLGVYVFIEDSSNGQIVNGVYSDPVTGGGYTMIVPPGSYLVMIDPATLPPGLALPTPRQISVATDDTITVQNNGVPVDTSVVDFLLEPSLSSISGSISLDGNSFSCVVELVDAIDPDLVLVSAPTNAAGGFDMDVPNGSFIVKVAPFSLPPGIVAPAGVSLVAASGFVTETAGTANDGVIDFALTQSVTQILGYVVDDLNTDLSDDVSSRLFAYLLVVDPTTGSVVAQAPTSPGEYFSMFLSDGMYDLLVDPPSLPLDVVPPLPPRIQITGSTVSLVDAGDATIDSGGRLRITATREDVASTVTVRVNDGSVDIGAAVEVLDGAGNVLFVAFVQPDGNGAALVLGDGDYSIGVIPDSVPAGFSVPDPTAVTVAGADIAVAISLVASSLTGTISNAFDGATQLVELDLLDAQDTILNAGLPLTPVGNDADYLVDLGDGSYFLALRRAPAITSAQVLLPDPIAITVADGIVQNPDDDPLVAGVQVNITVPPIAATVSGQLSLVGTPIPNVRIVAFDPLNGDVVNETNCDASGNYTIALPAGFFQLTPDPASIAANEPAALPAPPLELQVSASGDVAVISDPALCPGAGPNENCTGVDFVLATIDVFNNGEITGVVETRPDSSSALTPVAGVQVLLLDTALVPVGSATTDATGTYSIFADDGIYRVVLDPNGVVLPYPIVPPSDEIVVVSGTTVTEDNNVGTANVDDDGIVNFILEGATGLITGRVQTVAGVGVGTLLVITDATATEIPDTFRNEIPTSPEGEYFLPIGEGSFKLWVDPNFLPPGYQAPNPTTFSVLGTAITEADDAGPNNVANDGVINPIVTTGGGTIRARVLDENSNGFASWVALLQPAANPSDPPFYVTGAATDPATGDVTFTAANGTYFIEVDPGSLPPGFQSSGRVNLSISADVVSFATGTTTIIDGADEVAVITVENASTEIRGFVLDAVSSPIPTVVFAIDATTGAFVGDAPVDPASGTYAFFLANGVYDVIIDANTLPPGTVPPTPVRVSISGALASENNEDGNDPNGGFNAVDDGVVNFIVANAGTSLTGYVRDPNGNGTFANIGVFTSDSAGEYTIFVAGAPSDFATGFFEIPLATGSYQITVDPSSVPPGLNAPASIHISLVPDVPTPTINFPATATTENELGIDRLILELRAPTGGISGTVLDDNGNGLPVFVIVEDLNTGQFMDGAPTDPTGAYSFILPPGSYKVFVESATLPQGTIAPEPEQVNVTTAVVAGVDFLVASAALNFSGHVLLKGGSFIDGVTTVDCSNIATHVAANEVQPVASSVILLLPSSDPTSPPTFLSETFSSPADGFFSLPVGAGTYQLVIDGSTLPPGTVPPPPLTLVVSGGQVNISGGDAEPCTNDAAQQVIYLTASALTLNGTVLDPHGVPVGAFVEVLDANTGDFVNGTPTDPITGNFEVPLGDLLYEVRIDPFSVPAGTIPPAPVQVSTSGGVVTVSTVPGTDFTADILTINLEDASGSVSGVVVDADGFFLGARVRAFTTAGDFASDAWTDPATGFYTISLAPGVYEISVDPFTLPPGSSPPAAVTANLLQTPNSNVDFTVANADATITGEVFYDDNGTNIGVPAFVEVFNASDGSFVTAEPAQPDVNGNFVYTLNVGAGSFLIGIDPNSVPPGFVTPGPSNFSVTVNSISGAVDITESNTVGSSNTVDDGTISFQLDQAGVMLNGQVYFDDLGTPTGLSAFIRLELAGSSGALVAETPTDPNGFFSLELGDGSYDLIVDSGSLPPMFQAPAPQSVVVSGASITIDGIAPADPHLLQVFQSGATLTGSITRAADGSAVQGAFVFITEAASGAWVDGQSTDATGSFQLPLADGDFLFQIDGFTLPPDLLPPPPAQLTVAGSDIFVDGVLTPSLDFALAGAASTVTVEVIDDQGAPMFVSVQVRDALTDIPFVEVFTNGSPVHIDLPPGDYFVLVPNFALPPGFSAPPPASLTVNVDGTTVDSSGSPSDALLSFTVQAAAASVFGTVLFDGIAAPGVRVVGIDEASGQQISETFTDTLGMFFLDLPTGSFDILPADGLPGAAVPPAPFRVVVLGPGNVDPPDPIDFDLVSAVGEVAGTITLNGAPVPAFVHAFEDDGSGQWVEIAKIPTDAAGVYVLPLPEGDFTIIGEIEPADFAAFVPPPALLIAPLPFTADVDSAATTIFSGVDFAFFSDGDAGAPTHQVLLGTITAGGAPFDAPMLISTTTQQPMMLVEAEAGDYRVAIRAGSFEVGVFEEEIPSQFSAPAPVAIMVDGSAISGSGVTPDGPDFRLDLNLGVSGRAVFGTVTDFSGSPLGGIEVRSRDENDLPGPIAFTDATGAYSLVLGEGDWTLELGGGLPAGSVAPLPVAALVLDNAGTLELFFDSVLAASGQLDWQIAQGLTTLSGIITTTGFPAPADVVAFQGGLEVTATRSFDGTYDLALPNGTFEVVAFLDWTPPDVVIAPPLPITVDGSVPFVTHDFVFDFPEPTTNPGFSAFGRVTSEGNGYMTSVLVESASGLELADVDTDAEGYFTVTLAPGNYTLRIADEDLPLGFVGSAASAITITNETVLGAAVDNGFISFTLNTTGTLVSGTVTQTGGLPVAGAVLLFFPLDQAMPPPPGSPGSFDELFSFAVADASGDYQLLLPPGLYEVDVAGASLPISVVTPPGVDLDITGSTFTHDVTLEAAAAIVTGQVTIDGFPAAAEIIATDAGLNPVSIRSSDLDGDFVLPLAAGDYTIIASLEGFFGALLAPDPFVVTITAGNDVTGVNLDFQSTTSPTAFFVDGRLRVQGQAVEGEILVTKEIGGTQRLFQIVETNFDGFEERFEMILDTGSYEFHVQDELSYEAGCAVSPLDIPTLAVVVSPTGLTVDGFQIFGPLEIDLCSANPIGGILVTSVSPPEGPVSGGTPVTISGSGFAAGDLVFFAGMPANNVNVVDSQTIVCETPPGFSGFVDVMVQGAATNAVLAFGFEYIGPPEVFFMDPPSGSTAGNTPVTIHGFGFRSGVDVFFDGLISSNTVLVSQGQITCDTPPHGPGPATLTVRNVDGQEVVLPDFFHYADAPSIASVLPDLGPTFGG
ncbi:MAG: IPT/TIG domain-containing protein, partial [Planctomycetota bacterium]